VPDVGERLRGLEVEMEQVQEGIANFRDFQTEARRHFVRAERDEEHRKDIDKKRAHIHYWWLALLSGLILLMFGFLLSKLPNIHISFAHEIQSQQKAPQDAALPYPTR
jgi:uncharacterized membrane protein